jgi:hypothetical protein
MHGDDDRIVMHADSGPLSAKFLKNGTLKTHKGFPHGVPTKPPPSTPISSPSSNIDALAGLLLPRNWYRRNVVHAASVLSAPWPRRVNQGLPTGRLHGGVGANAHHRTRSTSAEGIGRAMAEKVLPPLVPCDSASDKFTRISAASA